MIEKRKLGQGDVNVGAIALGAMAFAGWYSGGDDEAGVRAIHRALDDIGFGQLSAPQARHLGLPAGHPCARVQRSAYDLSGRCVELRTTRGDAHAFHYTVNIT